MDASRSIPDPAGVRTGGNCRGAPGGGTFGGMPSEQNQGFLDFVLDQLSALRRVSGRRMFGGIGLYAGDEFFGLIDEGRLFFYADGTTRVRYEARGMGPYEYAPGKVLRSYYEVPVDILEDDAALVEWAREAVDAHKNKPRRKRTTGKRTA
jgi:DNA transformation protein and related proteins